MAELNPQQFFHGTTSPIKDGMVRPANDVDKSVSEYSMGDPGDMSEGDHAFVTRDENYAWNAAGTFHRNGMRPRVYETGPAPDMKPGPWNKDHPDILKHLELDDDSNHFGPRDKWTTEQVDRLHQPEYASKTGFPVRQRIDIMPGHQGTFPEINWNRFKEGGHRSQGLYETNHPEDNQVRYGMNWNEGVFDQAAKENNRVDLERNPPSRKAVFRASMEGKPIQPDPHRGQSTLF